METNIKFCASCAYRNPNTQQCVLTGRAITEEDFCSSHNTNPEVCETCGRYIKGHSFLEKAGERYIQICAQCATAISTCAGCKNSKCEFEQNPDPMPKMVMRQVRQGNAVMQASMRNPERIKKFCESCPCWDTEDRACNREFNCCGRHVSILNP